MSKVYLALKNDLAKVKNGSDLVITENTSGGFTPYDASYKEDNNHKDDGNCYFLLTNSTQAKRIHTMGKSTSSYLPQSIVCDAIAVGEYLIVKTKETYNMAYYMGTAATTTDGVVSWNNYAEYRKTVNSQTANEHKYYCIKNNEWTGVTYNAMFMPYNWTFSRDDYGISDEVISAFSLSPSNINANFEIIAGDKVVGKGASVETNRYFGSVITYTDTIDKLQDGNNYYKFSDQDARTSITAIKDGTSIDSFGDVETELSTISSQKANKPATVTITLDKDDWVSNEQTVSVTGMTSSKLVQVSPSPTSYSDYGDAEIRCTAQGTGTLTFECSDVPTTDIDVNVIVWGGLTYEFHD